MDRKKIFKISGGFLAVMLTFTILSRAVSGAAMAKVETVKISTGTIDHKITASGRAEAGKEVAVYTENGQRVREICVQEGQTVEAGEILFTVDLEELEEQIVTARQELQKLKLQGQDAQSARNAEQQNRQNARNRAAEDYNAAVAQGNSAVAEAKTAWDHAEQELQQFLQNRPNPETSPGVVVPQTDEDHAEKENEEPGSGKNQDLESDEDQNSQAKDNEKTGNENSSQENGLPDQTQAEAAEWEAKKAELEEAAAQAKAVYQTALSSRADNVKNAARALEDASAQNASDSTGEQNEITRQQQELTLNKLLRLKEAEGKVPAPVRGMVTNIAITTGEFTSEGTAILLADTSKGCRITASVSKTDEKYVSKGNPVTLTVSGSRDKISDYTVSGIAENKEDKTILDVTIDLPEGVVEAGTSVEIEIVQKSPNYNTVIPIEALYEEQAGYYVLILQEEQGVIGSELVAKRFEVEVVDKNSSQAALAEGMLTGEQEIICSSSRFIENGSRVRRKVE
ncbi:HlyD family efflux transporter periplasmic adaptor subunit [Lachnospiraceae bacterium]|nr:HlyD family efflux transporter periplasmic adaptor subunit [Lachnospiraceae bacterium]